MSEHGYKQSRSGTYHYIAVDVLNDKIADVLDFSIFLNRPGFASRVIRWFRLDYGKQSWVGIVYIVCVAGES